MSTKKLRSQLLAAVAMVLVAAIALGSSTFAWFAQNTKVTAESVDVTAQTAQNLSIALESTGAWGTSVELTNPSAHMWPVSATEGTTFIGNSTTAELTAQTGVKFYIIKTDNKVNSADNYKANVEMNSETLANSDLLAANFEESAVTNYWTDDFYLRYDYTNGQKTAINGKATVTLPDVTVGEEQQKGTLATADIVKALHVALVTADNKWHMGEVSTVTNGVATITWDGVIAELAANTPQLVKAYIWFEGEDTDCFTNASLAPKTPSVAFEFEIPTSTT